MSDAPTPQAVSQHMLKALVKASRELPGELTLDASVLILGMADLLGDLLSELPSVDLPYAVPAVLRVMLARIPNSHLLIMPVDRVKEKFDA
jgi:hypothetical protein